MQQKAMATKVALDLQINICFKIGIPDKSRSRKLKAGGGMVAEGEAHTAFMEEHVLSSITTREAEIIYIYIYTRQLIIAFFRLLLLSLLRYL